MEAQIVSQPLTIICVVFIFISFAKLNIDEAYLKTKVGSGIRFFGDLTLEIYLVQFIVIDYVNSLAVPFPINVLIVIMAVFLCAWILRRIDKRLIAIVALPYLS